MPTESSSRPAVSSIHSWVSNYTLRTSDGPDAVSYQLSQVGNDQKAQQFLTSLDDDPNIGRLIDQTMDYEAEQTQMVQKTGQDMSPDMWIMK